MIFVLIESGQVALMRVAKRALSRNSASTSNGFQPAAILFACGKKALTMSIVNIIR